jgi:CO/xanthine dehydrogenase FAD-binding subunit
VKPAPFAYHRPRTREEVDALLAAHGEDAKILAGGQSLVPIMSMRLATPAHVIDINFLDGEPTEPALEGDTLSFGPLVRQRAAERSPAVAAHLPVLRQALQHVAHPAIRSRGTVVGSIAHADPAAELPAVMVALGGEAHVRSARGRRTVRAGGLYEGPLQTALGPGEWIEEVRLPVQSDRTSAVVEFARRRGDYALCGVVALGDDVTYIGMGPYPGVVAPEDDIHATARYRVWLAERLKRRALT